MREKYPDIYQATFEQYLNNFPSVVDESAEQARVDLEEMIQGLEVLNINWDTELPEVAFTLNLKEVDLSSLVNLSNKAKDAQKAIDALTGANYSTVTYNGKSLRSNAKLVTVDKKVWEKLQQFIRQAFWNLYSAIYDNRIRALETSFLKENSGILYAV